MRTNLWLFCLMFSGVVHIAFASDCTPSRLDDPGESMDQMPILDQDSVGYCWAYTGTQMVDAWRFSHGANKKHLTSPLPIALDHTNGATNPDGSYIRSISPMRKIGSCDHNFVMEQILSGQSPKDFRSKIYKYFEENRKLDWERKTIERIKNYFSPYSPVENQILCEFRNSPPHNMKELSAELKKILYEANFADGMNLSKLMMIACKGHIEDLSSIPDIKSKNTLNANFADHWTPETRGVSFENAINNLLNKSPMQPVGIEYCANIFSRDRYFTGIERNHRNIKQCYPHASIVIGRRKGPDGQCQFLVRNSWGKDWCPNSKYAECDERQKGQAWVDAKILGRYVLGVSSFHSF